MAKALAGGANFIHGILTGYEELVPDDVLQSIFEHETQVRQEEHEVALAEYEVDQEAYADKIADGEPATAPVAPEHPQPVASLADLRLAETSTFNASFPGYGIAMPPPHYEDSVASPDGTPPPRAPHTPHRAHILIWAAEPTLQPPKPTTTNH